tara:strand:+ start:21 stop:596 length:576 start_codon:yes stop_codon:yes gene_type:complete
MQELIIILYSYFIGSIPFGLLLTKIFKDEDVRETGSGNIGASNVFRSSSKVLGLLTLLLDGLKGFLAVYITEKFFSGYLYLSALIVFLGHLYPVWLKFNGGKGVATFIGILFSINFILPTIFIISWILIIILFKFPSVSSLFSTLIILLFNVFTKGLDDSVPLFLFFVLIVYSHRFNISRLKRGTENKINL